MKCFIHESADVQSKKIGDDTKIWQNSVVLGEATIGENCNINANVFIENIVNIGNNVTIKSGVQIWDGITIEDNVFIGPNATFTNDIIPRSKQYQEIVEQTVIKKGASIGANATIIAGNSIEEYAMIGAGAVLTKPVGKNELWIGNPAHHVGYVTNEGILLNKNLQSKQGQQYKWSNNLLIESND